VTLDSKNDWSQKWPEADQFKKSIRLEFSIYVSAIIIILMLATGYVITDKYVKSATENAIERLLVQARSYSGPAGKHIIAANGPDILMLNNICKRLMDDNPDVYWVGITDGNDVFLAHSDINQVIASGKLRSIKSQKLENILREDEAFKLAGDTINISIPILENKVRLGQLAMASSMSRVNEARQASIITVVSITVIMLLIGLPFTMVLLHRKLRPISIITNHLKEINFDNFELNIPINMRNEFGYLAETLKVMGYKLNDAQRELIEKERVARELEIAGEIQSNILPRKFPKTSNFEFSGIYSSAQEVGGDYYDFIDVDDNHIAFLVADVSGKSLPGMLVMLLTRDIVKQLARKIQDPVRLLSETNKELLSNIKKGMFVTMFYGVLDKNSGEFSYASAGHNPLIQYNHRSGNMELIKTKGYPLGMIQPDQFDDRIEAGRLKIMENDWLVQYTDGINEAQNVSKEEFGMERFLKAIETGKNMNPSGMINNTMEQLKDFVGDATQYDDMTLLAIKWTGHDSGRQQIETKEAVVEN
jgi:serine phosphatase RsbU (regulator of sigma subunit)